MLKTRVYLFWNRKPAIRKKSARKDPLIKRLVSQMFLFDPLEMIVAGP